MVVLGKGLAVLYEVKYIFFRVFVILLLGMYRREMKIRFILEVVFIYNYLKRKLFKCLWRGRLINNRGINYGRLLVTKRSEFLTYVA